MPRAAKSNLVTCERCKITKIENNVRLGVIVKACGERESNGSRIKYLLDVLGIYLHTYTSFRVQRENQNLLKRNRHLCKSDSRFISTGNEVNVADRRKKTYRNQIESNQSLCLKLTLFSFPFESFWHFTLNLFADIIFVVL